MPVVLVELAYCIRSNGTLEFTAQPEKIKNVTPAWHSKDAGNISEQPLKHRLGCWHRKSQPGQSSEAGVITCKHELNS